MKRNQLISEEMGDKTPKQVSDKRGQPSFKNWNVVSPEPQLEVSEAQAEEPPDGVAPVPADITDNEEPGRQALAPPDPVATEEHPAPAEWLRQMVQHLSDSPLPEDETLAEIMRPLTKTQSHATVNRVYSALVAYIKSNAKPPPPRLRARKRRGAGRVNHARFVYARTQQLYQKNPSILSKHAVRGTDFLAPTTGNLKAADVGQLYEGLWGTKQEQIVFPEVLPQDEIPAQDFLLPFTWVEVQRRVRRFKRKTAAGLDGIRREDLIGENMVTALTLLLNAVMAGRKLPEDWNENRTTLIPKEGKDPSKVVNYRPITVSSLISRLFWSLIDQRLRRVIPLSPRQKGFVPEAGCFNNVQILCEVLKRMQGTGGVVVQLDVQKAFDTAPHEAIKRALQYKGIPEFFAHFVEESYLGVATSIATPEGGVRINLVRGVKQGDPLSPLLFTIILEPLLQRLEELMGFALDDMWLTVLAFADDLLLLAKDVEMAKVLLKEVRDFLAGLGMSLAADKSLAYEIVRNPKTLVLRDPALTLDGTRLPTATPETRLQYLGAKIPPGGKIRAMEIRETLSNALLRVKKLSLKPTQKLVLLRRFVIPSFLHALVLGRFKKATLVAMDLLVRRMLKKTLHLPASTSSELFYLRPINGGLGIPHLEHLVPRVALKLGSRYWIRDDPVMKALSSGTGLHKTMLAYSKQFTIPWPCSKYQAQVASDRHQDDLLRRWAAKPVHGIGVSLRKNDPIGNVMLRRPDMLKPRRFSLYLKVLTNTAGNKSVLRRIGMAKDAKCRYCGKLETLAHIVGACTYGAGLRISRHNAVCRLIQNKLEAAGVHVTAEVLYDRIPVDDAGAPGVRARKRDATGTLLRGEKAEPDRLKPDMTFCIGDTVYVLDVTIRREREGYFEQARESKIERYDRPWLLKTLMDEHRVKHAEILPIVFGAFGTVPVETRADLSLIGLDQSPFLERIARLVIDRSLFMLQDFFDNRSKDANVLAKRKIPQKPNYAKRARL